MIIDPYLFEFSSVNIPWPEGGMGDADYIYAFQKVVMPIAMEFAPELVISMSDTFNFVKLKDLPL
jgi:Histone deacetylase domain